MADQAGAAAVDRDLLERAGVRLSVDGQRATVTLDRPDTLNAQTPLTWEALRAVGAGLDSAVRVVVVRGAGRSFSAGLDRRMFTAEGIEGMPGLVALAGKSTEESDAEIAGFQQAFSWLRDPDRVTIAAVHGHAIGAGFQLALACDMRVLTEDAQFRMAETTLGLVPDLGGTLPLVRSVGYPRAVEICVTGRLVEATEAAQIGLANTVVPSEQLDSTVDQLVTGVLQPAAGAVRETVALLAQAEENADPEQQLAAERAAQIRRLAEFGSLLGES